MGINKEQKVTESQAKRLRILVGSGCVALMALVIVILLGERFCGSPSFEKERRLLRSLKATFDLDTYQAELRNLDTDAVPVLTKALETRPNAVDHAYTWALSNAPLTLRSNLPPPVDATTAEAIRIRASALLAERKIGEYVPPSTIVKELRDPSLGVRMNALACLNNAVLPQLGTAGLREHKETILTLVLAAAQDPEMSVRMSAVYCLGYFKDSRAQVLPILTEALKDSYPDVRIRAAIAFHRFDPAQAEKSGALSAAIECLHSQGPHGSGHLAFDFLKQADKLPPGEQRP